MSCNDQEPHNRYPERPHTGKDWEANVQIQQFPCESRQVVRARLLDYLVVDVEWTFMAMAGNPRSLREDLA